MDNMHLCIFIENLLEIIEIRSIYLEKFLECI